MAKTSIVFDLDETIGFFSQLGCLIDFIELQYAIKISNKILFDLFDVFHECFRPNIFEIFNFLKHKRNLNVYIYTNNNGGKKWVNSIRNYIEHKIKSNIFNKTICAWKVDNIIIEPKRTTYEKTYDDFINCTNTSHRKILFIDDYLHTGMNHSSVKYILVNQYYHIYDKETMLKKYLQTDLSKKLDKEYFEYLYKHYYNDPYMYTIKSQYKTNFLLGTIKTFVEKHYKQTKKNRKNKDINF